MKPSWKKPVAGWAKCNVDAAYSAETGQGGTGAVIRNDAGVFLGAQATPYAHCMDATTAEAWSCRDGMTLAMKCGVVKLCLESDCLELVRLWQSRETQRSLIAPVLMEMQDLSVSFNAFSLVYASRLCNKVAHEVARQAHSMTETVEWQFEAPSSIQSLLEADCNPVL
jgi:ribonuclease HI